MPEARSNTLNKRLFLLGFTVDELLVNDRMELIRHSSLACHNHLAL